MEYIYPPCLTKLPVCELLSCRVRVTGLFIRSGVLSQTSLSNQIGVLLLCEVAVKPYLELTHAKYDADAACKSSDKL